MTLSGGGRSVVIVAVQNTSTSTTLSNFRIDNCVITGGLSSTVFNIEGMVYGLIDNNTITGYGVLYYAGQDNYSWNTAFQAGTANMLYLEDNSLTGTLPTAFGPLKLLQVLDVSANSALCKCICTRVCAIRQDICVCWCVQVFVYVFV